MTATSLTVTIAGTTYAVQDNSLSLPDVIEQRTTCSFIIYDASGAYSFKKGQQVTVNDTLEGLLFTGSILNNTRNTDTGTAVWHNINCVDQFAILDGLSSNTQYTNQYAGAIAVDQIKDLGPVGILASYAVDNNTTTADFAAGTLAGTIASTNVGDGNLELAPSGAVVTVTENTTSAFSGGTLTNMTATNNSLVPTVTNAIKFVATQSVSGITNSFTYIKIWSGSVTIVTGRYLAYDIWISSTSPEAKIGVDLHYSDGTSLRDLAVNNADLNYDSQNKAPHPNTDLSGLAVDQWYHRRFLLDTMSGKVIDYVTIAMEGDKSGTYTAWIKNIYEVDINNNIVNTFFFGSLTVNIPQQMQRQGYGASSVSVVGTYDCSTAKRVSPAYSINHAKILKNSYISFVTNLPPNYTFKLEYSLDGGNSFTTCANNTSLPNLLAGLSISGKTIQFRQSFAQGTGAYPDASIQNAGVATNTPPKLTFLQCTINPSYTATKSDVKVSATTNSEWNTGTTFNNTQAPAALLLLLGTIRNWVNGDLSNQTLFGGAATGPNNANSCFQFVDSKQFRMQVHQSTEARSRCDFAGNWQNFIMEFDVYIDNNLMKPGCVYRTTGWSNFDANYAYAVEIFGTTIALQRGSNSSAGSAGTRTQVATATVNLTSQTIHRIKLIISGSNHQIFFDDTLAINATDATYGAAGNVGFRISNGDTVNGYIGLFDNFGITVTGLSGTWLSPSTSLTAASTYLNSVVSWQDVSVGNSTNLLVESTINGGSTFQTVTNGGSIPNLTLAQSLSGISVQFRITLTTATASDMPQMQYFVAYILGGFSSSGTRINKALLLTSVGTCGSTLVSWNALTPANTSVAFATSLDGTTYTSISSGGSIAGINQQPAPTLDSFNLITSGNYTSTFGNGGSIAPWVWDTVNSRVTVTGGSLALLLYGAISTSDVDVICDLDRADIGGVVFRSSNTSNYYELVANDSLSSNTPNKLVLARMSGGSRTFPAQGNIAFTRGDKHRIRVTMIGGLITAYFDGVQIFQYTDGSPLAGGKAGLVSDTGTSQFYNLRIQPQGDNLSGKLVYVKETLTSTDPVSTPQITDMVTLVTNPNIAIGSLIPAADYRQTYRSDNIKSVATQSNYYLNIKPDGSFVFIPRQTFPVPWPITTKDTIGLKVEDSADLYRNRQTIKGVLDTLNANETKIGDGSSTSWVLEYNVVSITSMTLNGQPVTFGVKGVDTGKNFYYAPGSNSIYQDASGTLLIDTDSLLTKYVGQFSTYVTRDNTGQFPGTISQKDYIAQSGLTIPTLVVLNQISAAKTVSGSTDDLTVSLCRTVALDINITTISGTSPTIQFFFERKDAAGNYNILYQTASINANTVVSRTIGKLGQTTEALGSTIRLRWTITGTTPSFTFNASIIGNVDAGLANIGVVEAIEDVSGKNVNVAAANTLGDALLQYNGAIGRTISFKTKRTGLAAGQYAPVFIPELSINDAQMLITTCNRTQKFKMDTGSPSQSYFFDVVASEGPILPTWQKAMSDAGIGAS